ncbi:MAG: NAD(P)/FAD-dependent oxidoreductase [Bacteroidales bacterium]|nr:NAD(P)/FAD-dependent oxidoreductase [Bacteroidales bacterium]MCF8390739.1 NAD(P)/FAD-dependent oxidoreductase [Bacteroidales bacterium]
MQENKYDTIIVGAGIGGLTSAVYLAREGQKVLLIEKNHECGGLVNSFVHNGFHFEAGVRALEDAGIIFPMLKDLGIELEVVKSYVSVGVENEIVHVKDLNSLTEYKQLLIKLFPDDKVDIERILKIIRKIMKHMEVLYGIENPVFKDLKRDRAFIFKKLLPWFPKFIFTVGKINRMNMPIEDYLKTIIKNPALRDVISQHFFKNTPSFFALSYFSLYLDYFYPKGGVGKLATAVKDKVIESGGEIKTGTKIIEVLADKCIVKDDNNTEYQYDNLVWAADLKLFYNNTNTKGLSPQITDKFEDDKKKVLETRGGDSIFSLFLEIDEPLESFKKIAHGHFFYTPSKIGLGDTHWGELNNLLNNWEGIDKEQVLNWVDKFIRLNTFEISIPGLKDPDLVPGGKTAMVVSFLAEYNLFKKLQESEWLEEFKIKIEELVLKVLSESIYPMLKDKVIHSFSFTPLSYHNRVGTSEGAITGWSFEKPIPVVSKIQFSDRSVLTSIPNIYQAGQWAYSPAGVPMCILTGKLAADRIIKKNK